MPRRYSSVLTRKGQATIPVEIRDKLGWKEGDKLVWYEDNGEIVVMTTQEHVRRTAGMLKPYIDPSIPSPTDEEMDAAIEAAIVAEYLESVVQR